jgi:glycosyltransferase involved in cell wall biosynthesis
MKSPVNTLRILVTATTFPRWKDDKVPSFILDFAKNINKSGSDKEVRVLAPHYKGAKKKELIENIKVKRFRYAWPASAQNLVYEGHAGKKAKNSIAYLLKLAFFVCSQFWSTFTTNADVINAHWLVPQGFTGLLVAKIKRKKLVITIHGGDVFLLNKKPILSIKKLILRFADKVIVNSSATLKQCQKIYSKREYTVIPMGIDIDRFKPKYRNPNKEFTIIFVGRLSSEKGVIYLLQATKKIIEDGGKIKVLIAGDGPEKNNLEDYITKNRLNKYVKLLGWQNRDQTIHLYQQADVFVGLSIVDKDGLQEALGLVFIESLACGTPVITTNTGGIKDIIVDGQNGAFVRQKDPVAAAAIIKEIMNNRTKLNQMKKEARKSVVDKFSWGSVVERYLCLFTDL